MHTTTRISEESDKKNTLLPLAGTKAARILAVWTQCAM
jgi:hypothetical protein